MAARKTPRTLLTGWFTFLHGEVTAGDVLALERVREVLGRSGIPHDTAWSPGFRPDALRLEDADPARYTHVVFVCGPLHGPQVARLHERYADCVRVAVGVSVIDPGDPAVRGFHHVLPRDADGVRPTADLAAAAPGRPVTPVAGVVLTHGQGEYGGRRRHEEVAERVTGWLARTDCARVELDTRLAPGDWRLCRTPAQLQSVLARLDVVVTDRLHGLVLALRAGVPALAVDPVEGGAKVTAQARVHRWPALVPAERLTEGELDRWWRWCLLAGRAAARRRQRAFRSGSGGAPAEDLVEILRPAPEPARRGVGPS
ncbi:polysaccharide pyruvyl transferase family protein [Streptomyces sp. DH37]|uniref:polysaccharide pyruvyl transferase family protein n=1 Tax=Streptomyces sp. DH37 TaxID=3040122 RepID=UPI0024417730|nr:polysaccharide pyruvyl transferase family protein [Streptomyces sp. DH37]MDG9701275.1 polysaccharide pyruvyl transferase family protein [Streptomyces sp. DH37]